ncbi:MAG: hypothetical protein KJ601_07790 [Nanoarchaeota archaeon]|nr:hypothetical protein [Nanoarchaeota archaeon]MBU1704375.1 hypothetical protein [Nanoarchaeota archaeon]
MGEAKIVLYCILIILLSFVCYAETLIVMETGSNEVVANEDQAVSLEATVQSAEVIAQPIDLSLKVSQADNLSVEVISTDSNDKVNYQGDIELAEYSVNVSESEIDEVEISITRPGVTVSGDFEIIESFGSKVSSFTGRLISMVLGIFK